MACVKECEEAFYVCNVCRKRFRQENTFQLHRLIHKNEQTFSCDICKEEFQFLSRLQKHCLLKHSNNLLVVGQELNQVGNKGLKPFVCNLCDKGFTVHSSLQKHILRVHGSAYLNGEEQSFQSLTITNDSNCNNYFHPTNDFSNVTEPTGSMSAELCIKEESETSCDESVDPGKMCTVLWDESPSSDGKRNHAEQDFLKTNLSQMKPARSAENRSEKPALCEEGLADSTDGRNNMSLPTVRKPKAGTKYRTKKRGKRASAQKTRRAKERSQKTQTGENIQKSFNMTENASLETGEQDEPKKQLICHICDRKFSQRCHLQNHMRTHAPKTAYYSPRFTTDQPLSNQPSNAVATLNIGPYLCETCHERFVKNEDFQKHCLTHSEQNTYTCRVCNLQFTRYTNFRAHCETHLKKKSFDCNLCGTSFYFQKHLIEHQQTQSVNRKLKCKFCTERFDHACSLINHEQTHSGYHCEDCGSVFSMAGDLKKHQRSHVYESKCGVCAKTFANNDLLRQHLEAHFDAEILLYRCEVCSEEFELEHHLRTHRTTHQDDMPHMCQLCNEDFLSAWSLRNHLLEHEASQDEAELCPE